MADYWRTTKNILEQQTAPIYRPDGGINHAPAVKFLLDEVARLSALVDTLRTTTNIPISPHAETPPMSVDPCDRHAAVSSIARFLWIARGQPTGLDDQIWYDAEAAFRSVSSSTGWKHLGPPMWS